MSAFSVTFLLIPGFLWRISNTVQPVLSWVPCARTPAKSLWTGTAKSGDCAGPELGLESVPTLGISPERWNPAWLCLRRRPLSHPKCPLWPVLLWSSSVCHQASCSHMKEVCGCLASHGRQAHHPKSERKKEGSLDSGLWWKNLETPVPEKSWLYYLDTKWNDLWGLVDTRFEPHLLLPQYLLKLCGLENHDKGNWLLLVSKVKHESWESTFSYHQELDCHLLKKCTTDVGLARQKPAFYLAPCLPSVPCR